MDLIIITCTLLVMLAIYRLTIHFQRRRSERMQGPVTSDIVNTTNYQITAEEFSHSTDLDQSEARAVIQNWRRAEQIPAPRDFYRVKRAVEEKEEGNDPEPPALP